MKKVKITDYIYVQKPVEVEKFETDDGKLFSSEEEAQKHEKRFHFRKNFEEKYRVKEIDPEDYGIEPYMGVSSKIMFIKEINEETTEDLKNYYEYLKSDKSPLNNLKRGWNVFTEEEWDSCGLGRWSGYHLHIYPVNEIVKDKMKQIENLREFIDDQKDLDEETIDLINKNFWKLL
jgi:hypothetical protein